MLVNIANILDKDYFEEELSIDFDEKIFSSVKEIEIKYPIKAKLLISKSLSNITFKLTSNLEYEAVCSRCLEKYISSLTINSEGYVVNKKDHDKFPEENSLFVKDKAVLLDDFLYQEILSAMPMKFLCKDECKGLCIKCGENLNSNSCECDKHSYDLRLEKLKELTFDR
ncbi:MAG: DUF177 domain-containing protein [Tissierellales bacterium]|nr:DUF177 domain-containing protein [Tissierellales bacterium]